MISLKTGFHLFKRFRLLLSLYGLLILGVLSLESCKSGKTIQVVCDLGQLNEFILEVNRNTVDNRDMSKSQIGQRLLIHGHAENRGDHWILTMNYDSILPTGPKSYLDILTPQFRNSITNLQGFYLEFKIDDSDTPITLINYDACVKLLDDLNWKQFFLQFPDADSADFLKNLPKMKLEYSTPQGLIDYKFPELALFFSSVGNDLTEGQTLEGKRLVSSALGGEMLPVKYAIEITSLTEDTMHFQDYSKGESSEIKRIIKNQIGDLSYRGEDVNQLPPVNLEIKAQYHYSLKSGLVGRMEFVKVFDFGPMQIKHLITLKLKPLK